MMVSWEELGDWITWALIVATTIFIALVAISVLIITVCEVIHVVRRRLRGGGGKAPAMSLDEVLAMIPDYFPYHQELAGDDNEDDEEDDDDRDSCVICVEPFEHGGEACGVLPECGHVFHKLCVAEWLRHNSTCPLCRAAFDVTTGYGARRRQDDDDYVVSAAENMV